MNVKNRVKGTKYKGSLTIKKRPYLWDANKNVIHLGKKHQIKTRTYKRIHNAIMHGGYAGHMIGGGKEDPDKEAKENAKKEEKARKEEEKRVLEEEKAKKKAEQQAEKKAKELEKKDKEEADKIKAEEDKAKKDAEKKEKQKPPEKEKGANKAENNTTKGPKLNIDGVPDTETEEDAEGELKKNKVTQETAKVLKLEEPVPGANETDVDAESVAEPAGNKAAEPAGNKAAEPAGNNVKADNKPKEGEAKKGRWASFKETMKKKASNAAGYITQKAKNLGNGIKKVAWGDANTSGLGKAGKLLASPFSLPLTGLYKSAKATYKLGVGIKDRAGLFVKRLGVPESMRLVKKFNTWKTTRKAATGELKKQKYEEKFAKKKEEISGYSQEIMLLESKGEDNLNADEKKRLKELRSKMDSAEYDLDLISIKKERWKIRSAKSKLELNKLQESRILPSTKNKINNRIQQKQDDLNKQFATRELNIKKNVATRVANLDTDTDFKAELARKETELDAELAKKLSVRNLNDKEKEFLNTQYARQKAALAQKLKDEKEKQFVAEEQKKLADVKKAAQTQIYSDQINEIAKKLGVNIDAKNPQLKAILEQHHADPTAKPLTGDELIKKVSEVGFGNIIANKQTIAQANKYLSAPQAVFKAGEEEAAIAKLGSNTAKQSFYKEYVRDARAKLDAKLTELSKAAAGKNGADAKVKLTRLKAQLETMDKDKRFKGADQDLYLYNLLKSNEQLLGISTISKVNEANNAKTAIKDTNKLNTAVEAYYNARLKPLDETAKTKLAALYYPELKTYLAGKKRSAMEENKLTEQGLIKYKEHIKNLLTDNPLALKVENPAIYNQIFNPQKTILDKTNPSVVNKPQTPANQQVPATQQQAPAT